MNAASFLAAQVESLLHPGVQTVIVICLVFALCVLIVLAIGGLMGLAAWLTRPAPPADRRPDLRVVPGNARGPLRF